MKLFRVFVHASHATLVLDGLRGFTGGPVLVSAEGSADSGTDRLLFELAQLSGRQPRNIVKIETVCPDDEADRIVAAVRAADTDPDEDTILLVTSWQSPSASVAAA